MERASEFGENGEDEMYGTGRIGEESVGHV
jgi:hypothetical protein